MASLENCFRTTLSNFKECLTREEQDDFSFSTLEDVRKEIARIRSELKMVMVAGAKIDQLPAQTHGSTHRPHMARDALRQESALEAVMQKDHRPVPGISKEPAIGNGYLQCTSSSFNQQCLATAESYPDTQTMWYGMQAACSLEARRQPSIAQSLVRHSRTQILVENNQLDRRGEVSQKREALNCDLKVLGSLQRRYQKVSVITINWAKDKDEEGSFDAQDEVSDLRYLTRQILTLDRL
jgi:hypothetical protein